MVKRSISRWLAHVFGGPWQMRRAFPSKTLVAIEQKIREVEAGHSGQIRFAVEATLDLGPLLRGQSARARALEHFSALRIWDTEQNNGVLIYVLLADRDVEIVADRDVSRRVTAEDWEEICRTMERHFARNDFERGALEGIQAVGAHLARHYAGRGDNELSDAPVVL